MYPGSNPELVAAASAAGAFGLIQPLSLTHLYGHDFREGLRRVKELSGGAPFGVNITIVPNKRYMKRVDEWMTIALEEDCKFFLTSLGKPDALVTLAHAHGAKVYHDVHTEELARRAVGAGVDGVNLLNDRMGGQTGASPPLELLRRVRDLDLDVPLVCAGGVGDEVAFGDMLDAGYAGVMSGTRFLATHECAISESPAYVSRPPSCLAPLDASLDRRLDLTLGDDYKNAIVDSSESDIVRTNKLAGTWSSVIKTPAISEAGLEVNAFLSFLLRQPMTKGLARVFLLRRSIEVYYKDDTRQIWQAGKGVAGITQIEPVAQVVDRFARELDARASEP